MDNSIKMIKDAVYNVLQEPTRENFIDNTTSGVGQCKNENAVNLHVNFVA